MYAHARIELMSWFNANGPAQAHVRWKAKTLRNGYCPDHNILAKTFFFFVGHFATIISVTRTFRVKCYNLFSIFFFALFAIRWAMSDAKAFIHSSSYFIVSYRTVSFVYRIKRETMIKLSCWFWLSAVIYIDHTTSYVVCVCVCGCGERTFRMLCACVRTHYPESVAKEFSQNLGNSKAATPPHMSDAYIIQRTFFSSFILFLRLDFFQSAKREVRNDRERKKNVQKKRFQSKEFETRAFQLSSTFCFEDFDFPIRSIRKAFILSSFRLGSSNFGQFNQRHEALHEHT